ncbi:chemotaxis protein CheW [Paenibacillus hodogayensis]|uniref:Chemotaxis protein CheW n=1 Tax=Paenibacillus hodogayensis TaxID=279208 RepID=A0ABV5W7N6_9BACL
MNDIGGQYVVFSINGILYGIPILEVSEIIRRQPLMTTMQAEDEFLGILSLRRKIVPVLSLHRLFREPEPAHGAKTERIMIIAHEGREIGIVVDEVSRVLHLSGQPISTPPYMARNKWINGLYQHGELLITLLRTSPLFDAERAGFAEMDDSCAG